MRAVISPEYLQFNQKLHADEADYGAHGNKDAHGLAKIARDNGMKVLLDYGCGKGALKRALNEIAPELTVLEFDPAIPGKDSLPTVPIDFLMAMDVMEHVEPDYLDAVLATMRDLRPKLVLLKISLTPAKKTLPDGRNAHLLVQSREWWMERLGRYFQFAGTQPLPIHLAYYGVPLESPATPQR